MQQQTHYSSADHSTFKYFGESYIIVFNFSNRLRPGQTVQSGTVIVTDVKGNDITASFVEQIAANSTSVPVRLKSGGGVVGQFYYMTFRALTQEDTLEQILEIEVR